VLDGDTWRIDGQKVWTSQAQFAQWIFVLCRTELEEKAHKALSYLLVPIDQPGVEVRPLKDLSGNDHFCEVFFDGAVTSADMVVGGRGNGWKTAMGTLGFERGTAFMAQQLRFAKEFANVKALAHDSSRADNLAPKDQSASCSGRSGINASENLKQIC
jgi:alkylation response protein AidB-like acyl-CoA dehydrogenase